MARFEPTPTARVRERAILVGADFGRNPDWTLDESMGELERLAETDGADVVPRSRSASTPRSRAPSSARARSRSLSPTCATSMPMS